jgi:glucuronokinase
VLAFTFEDFRAEATVKPARGIVLGDPGSAPVRFAGWEDLRDRPVDRSYRGATALLFAAARIFAEQIGPAGPDASPGDGGLRLAVTSDIPRQVGLAGSSAIIIAALRALAGGTGIVLPPMRLATMALIAERDLLGIAAGPQDRVIQAHGGFLDMDFAREPWTARPMDPRCLPPLFVAWELEPGESSGATHGDLRARWMAGDPDMVAAIAELRSLVEEGGRALETGDRHALRRVVDRNYDVRASLCRLSPEAARLVTIGRARGAGVKFCGSGGAVVGVVEDEGELSAMEEDYRAAGCGFLRPRLDIAGPGGASR